MKVKNMKSYVLLLIVEIFLVALVIEGCGDKKIVSDEVTEMQKTTEASDAETPILEQVTDTSDVEEDLSIDTVEDDYGDII